MAKISKGGAGMTVFLISLFSIIGFEVPDEMIENAVAGFFALLGLIMWMHGQFDRKDLKFGLFRK